jgi:hypothetical protein
MACSRENFAFTLPYNVHLLKRNLLTVNSLKFIITLFTGINLFNSPSQWPRDLRRGSAAVRLLRSRVRVPPGALISVSFECCVLSGRGLCVGLITRPEESYRVWCVWVWSWSFDNEEALAHLGLLRHWKKETCLTEFAMFWSRCDT